MGFFIDFLGWCKKWYLCRRLRWYIRVNEGLEKSSKKAKSLEIGDVWLVFWVYKGFVVVMRRGEPSLEYRD